VSIEVLTSTNSTILTLTIITKQDSIKTLEKPTLVHMSSQTYTIGNAKNVITCFGHQKCHTSSSSSSDSGASDEGLKTIIQFFV
jgi:hypothetical protein